MTLEEVTKLVQGVHRHYRVDQDGKDVVIWAATDETFGLHRIQDALLGQYQFVLEAGNVKKRRILDILD